MTSALSWYIPRTRRDGLFSVSHISGSFLVKPPVSVENPSWSPSLCTVSPARRQEVEREPNRIPPPLGGQRSAGVCAQRETGKEASKSVGLILPPQYAFMTA